MARTPSFFDLYTSIISKTLVSDHGRQLTCLSPWGLLGMYAVDITQPLLLASTASIFALGQEFLATLLVAKN